MPPPAHSLAESWVAASYDQGKISYPQWYGGKNHWYWFLNLWTSTKGEGGRAFHIKKKKKRLGFNKYNSKYLVWENKAQAKQFESKQYGRKLPLYKELLMLCTLVNVMGEKKKNKTVLVKEQLVLYNEAKVETGITGYLKL